MRKINKCYRLAEVLKNRVDQSSGSPPGSGASQEEILIVDDDDLSRKLLTRLVAKEFDYKIVSKANGIEALEYAKENVPMLIILDLMLPGMNGFDILKTLRKDPVFEETKIVLVSAKSRSEDIERGFDLTADEYITKPFQPRELTARLRKLLTKAA